jgi:succinate-semialdehyde dehydrogenase / glutarate-semialdehyde dehydrogenase
MTKSIYINGSWIKPESGESRDIINPATGEIVTTVDYGGKSEAKSAVAAAHDAFPAWKALTVYQRALYLSAIAGIIRDNQEDLSKILTSEVGKTLPEARGEINGAADQYEWYAEEVKRAAGDVIPNRLSDKRHLTIRHPVGPVAAISPWNFPILLSARKIAPALAAGCTVINRPASQAPLTMIRVIELIQSLDLPKGVLNLVVGNPGECSDVFIGDSRIKKISFTGSLEVGRELYMACADRMKKISLELGGHSPFIFLPDVSVEDAAESAVFSKYRNMGQVCISASRFFIHNSKKKAFEEQVVERVSKLRVGNGLASDTDVGPLFEEKRVQDSLRFVEDILKKGGEILWGGKKMEGEAYDQGFFFQPTVATNISKEMLIMQEEPFSPIMPIIGYDSVEEAIEMANDTPFGLAAYVKTNNLKWTIECAEKLEAGIIGINDCSPAAAQCPFGGMKMSGTGREGWKQGLEAYFETKYISLGF